jgi:hypothetical protein
MGEARDWGSGLPLKASMLGKMNKLEVHHIFPKAQLYKHKQNYSRPEVNALANFCFLTKETNLIISDRLPEEYFPEIEAAHPGALASQWIPMDPALWKMDRFRDFLEARKSLLAAEVNRRMEELLHGDIKWLGGPAAVVSEAGQIGGGVSSEEEQETLDGLNNWLEEQGLPRGELSFTYCNPETNEPQAIFDLAWPNGIQEELSSPVAVLLNEGNDVLSMASQAGFRCFTGVPEFRRYVMVDILAQEA